MRYAFIFLLALCSTALAEEKKRSLLIIGQAVVLEAVTTGLMRFLRSGRSE